MTVLSDREQLVRDAIRELVSRGATRSDALVQSVMASVAEDPRLRQVAEEALAPEGAVLALHLHGPGVRGHHTDADHFGLFVRHLADATKEVTKQFRKRQRMATDLQISPLFAGSVGVRFLVPTRPEPSGTGKLMEVADTESDALRLIAEVMSAASDESLGDELSTRVQTISAAGRQALKAAVREQVRARWDLAGVVTQPGEDPVEMVSSQSGAQRLWDELERAVIDARDLDRRGILDGYKHSKMTMWFIEDSGAKYSLAIDDRDLLRIVAQIGSTPDQPVQIGFLQVTSTPPGNATSVRRARTLRSIVAIE